jgi:hypothetical protein
VRRKTKKQQRLEDAFDVAVEEHLREKGATTNEGYLSNMYPLRLPTDVGDLLVHANGSWVAMRFVDVERAKQRLPHGFYDRLNQFSGKYNAHFSDDGVGDLECVRRTLDSMLADVLVG